MATPAWKAASDLADGYLLLNPVTLKKYERHEIDALLVEIEKLSRDLRGQVIPQDQPEAVQQKNRKLLRLSQGVVVLQNWRSRLRPGAG
ncbi:MAG TPA: hypothetical protein PLB02_06600 [Thermoanaerobaculia bacterium]|nr:hypothetical protein [Thermoanaerobaculia bacterium]HQR67045.1 hypothetical protein [Thermoanaerobaculia bacterium]